MNIEAKHWGDHMNTVKKEVIDLLAKLPDTCTIEDIQYHLYVINKIKTGIERAEKEGVISEEAVKQRLSKWISK